MSAIHLVAALALLQYLLFDTLVGKTHDQYGMKAPAVTGHEGFERMYRVQMNTLELLVAFLPALGLAGLYWSPVAVAAVGAVFILGRHLYWRAYVSDLASRSVGFVLSFLSVIALLLATLAKTLLALPQ